MRLEMGQFHQYLDGPGGVSKTVGAVESHADRHQNSRTIVFPGILFYYLLYGGYLALLRLLSHTSSSQNRELIIERLGWTDLYSYLSWIIRHFGMPKSATLVVESRLLGVKWRIEPRICLYLSKSQGDIFVDVGAYHGHYPILLRNNFKDIIAIEPVPTNMAILRSVLAYRRVRNVGTMKVAVGAREGIGDLRLRPQPSESRVEPVETPNRNADTARIIALDDVLCRYPAVNLVKLDVEGAEFLVLEGARKSFAKVSAWMVELHDRKRWEQLEDYMVTQHYRTRWLDRGHLFAWRSKSPRAND